MSHRQENFNDAGAPSISVDPRTGLPLCRIDRPHLEYLDGKGAWFVTTKEVLHRLFGPPERKVDREEEERQRLRAAIEGVSYGHSAWYSTPIPVNIAEFVDYLNRKLAYDQRVRALYGRSQGRVRWGRTLCLVIAACLWLTLAFLTASIPLFLLGAFAWVALYGPTLASAPRRWRASWPLPALIPLLGGCLFVGALTFTALGTAVGDQLGLPYVARATADACGGVATLVAFGAVFLTKKGHDALQTPIESLAPHEPTPELPPPPPAPVQDEKWFVRGAELQDELTVRSLASHILLEGGRLAPHYFWGGVPQRIQSTSNPHKLLVGSSGSGKTLAYRVLMASTLPLPRSWRNRDMLVAPGSTIESWAHWTRSFSDQAVVYDAKTENIPFLAAQGFDPDKDLYILSPLDTRCYAWNMAEDMSEPDKSEQLAKMMVPDDPNAKPFFVGTSRTLIDAIIQSFVHAAEAAGHEPRWTLRDILVATRTEVLLRHVISHHRDAEAELEATLDTHRETTQNILTTLRSHLRPFRVTAALWDYARRQGRTVSLQDWIANQSGTVLVIPDTNDNRAVYGVFNTMLFERLATLLLDNRYKSEVLRDGRHRLKRRYVFLDELGTAGKFPELDRLLSEGRSFGVEIAIGLQAISQLEQTYGEAMAKTLLDLFSFTALFRTGGPNTAEWMSRRVGQAIMRERRTTYQWGTTNGRSFGGSTSHTEGGSSGSTGSQSTSSRSWSNTSGRNWGQSESEQHGESYFEHEFTESPVLPSEFMYLDDIESSQFVPGYYTAPHLPIWKATLNLEDVLPYATEERSVPPRVEHTDKRNKELQPWGPEDFTRLGLRPLPGDEDQGDDSNDDPLLADFGWSS